MEKIKIYLSGPDRLKKDAEELFKKKKELCEKYGFELLEYPQDLYKAKDSLENNERIAKQRLELIRECDVLIADTIDFRSFLEPYSESAFELGIGFGLFKKLYCYMPDTRLCHERYSGTKTLKDGKSYVDENGIGFEPGPVNLMLEYGAKLVKGDLEDALKTVAADFGKGWK